jgi:energy-coupling factor transporter ATP-binding protein EcfA2
MPCAFGSGQQDTVDGVLVETISRRDFLYEFRRDYARGQHVTLIGPTGRGKSTLAYECLNQVISPDMQVTSLHGKIKGRDPVVNRAARRLNLRVVDELPDQPRRWVDRKRKFNGYLMVPLTKPGKTIADENALLRERFGAAIHHNYKIVDWPTITHINETHQTQVELKLKELCEAPLMRGGPDNAEWNEIQRGRYVSYHCYGAPEHMFVFYDDDRDNRKRYADFGVADPAVIEYICSGLKTARARDGRTISQCLYMRRSGGMFVIDT